jgi:hypothetical protein
VRAVRLVLAGLALLLALLALLLAVDVGRFRARMQAGDRIVAANPQADVDWTPDTLVPFDPARRLVGLDIDVALRRAIRAFVVARHTGEGFDDGASLSRREAAAAAALEKVVLAGSPRQASRADVLLGVLEFNRSSAPAGLEDAAQQSVNAFTEGARLDPANTAAKFDLELLLRALAPVTTRPGSNPAAGGKGRGQHGAGAGLPGNGF